MQLWHRVPPGGDPLTHINFFTPISVNYLLALSGYEALTCELQWHYTKKAKLVVRAIARKVEGADVPTVSGAADYSLAMMHTTPWAKIKIIRAGPWRAFRAATSVWMKRA
ncbi:unnamed protein product, partial [marine sediment metagenome]